MALAAGLRRLGLVRGDRVAVYVEKSLETVAALFGTTAAGGVVVPVNPLLRARQVEHVLTDSGARVVVTSPERLDTLKENLGRCPAVEQVVLVGNATTDHASTSYRVVPWADVVAEVPGASTPSLPPTGIDTDVAAILYTSGSTGRPKGVVLSHRNLLVGALTVSEYLGNTADDVILSALPLSFDAGLSQVTTAFAVGAHVVLMNYLLPGDVVRLCAKHRVTGLTCVPPLWIQIAAQAWPPEASASLRYFANTGGRMPKTTLDQLRAAFPAAVPYLMYGLTEAFRSTYLDPAEIDRRPDSIGKAIPNAEILVLRPDGTECDPGEEGELVHRGALVAMGYWNDAERTAKRFRPLPARAEGLTLPELAVWSGDVVVRDEEGFLYFVGRTDEMIKTSGYRVSPTEIEEVAYDSGLVSDAVAVGVEDAQLGQHIVLVVSPAAQRDGDVGFDERTLLAHFKRSVPLYMVPRRVVVTPQIPRSPNGKFDRARIHEELTSR
jgi:acyl-CoA ligase (AMP-forming) (exosortase A-associated)